MLDLYMVWCIILSLVVWIINRLDIYVDLVHYIQYCPDYKHTGPISDLAYFIHDCLDCKNAGPISDLVYYIIHNCITCKQATPM